MHGKQWQLLLMQVSKSYFLSCLHYMKIINSFFLLGSRKSSPIVKLKNTESNKKLKHKVEEAPKRSTPTPKRRRQ